MNKKAVISFSHTNYCLRSAGTEKFIRSLSKSMQQAGYSHLNLFSFYDDKNLMKTKLFGVNYNDKFVGIYKYDDMIEVVNNLLYQYSITVSCIHLEHLLHHDMDMIRRMVILMKVPVYIMVHDYFLVCPELKLISTKHGFCGLTPPSQVKCSGCAYESRAREHFDVVTRFLKEISPWLQSIVTPSEYVAEGMKQIFPELKRRIVLRQHLEYDLAQPMEKLQGKIHIAFAGAQMSAKGYDRWEDLVSSVPKGLYDFYYLGIGTKEIQGVKNVYVSSAEQGDDAMAKALKANGIHVAFLWPNWAETYSYILYELSENGVYILTNPVSGNICDVVKKEKNGQVFEKFQDCVDFLMNEEKIREAINQFRTNGRFHIKNVRANTRLEDVIPAGQTFYSVKEKNKNISKINLATLLYRIKYCRKFKW